MTKKEKIHVGEEFRIAVTLALQKFRHNEEQKEFEFPSSFTSVERAYIHRYCVQLGLKSKSRGDGANRYLTVYKKEGSTIVQADAVFELGRVSRQHTLNLLQRYPVSARERQELLPPTERDRLLGQEAARDVNRTTGRLNNGIPQVPSRRVESEFTAFRQSLPIWNSRDEIIQTILRHQVVLISGDTGSGKTTQVPQYILDHCNMTGQACRIICTQPRRLAALSVAERVAAEREDKVGQTVGYQIRLESRVSPKTLLTFCTNGVLLRTLMGGDASVATVTHIIVDELHERDRFSDFLLVILRDLLLKFRNLKLILMSAVLDTQLFVKYFGGCPVIEVPGRTFEVKMYFLEDVLKSTGYASKAMMKYKRDLEKLKTQRQQLASWCSSLSQGKNNLTMTTNDSVSRPSASNLGDEPECRLSSDSDFISQQMIHEKTELEPQLAAAMDQAIQDAWLTGCEETFSALLQIILSENVSVDYQHSETSVSTLMVAAGRGNFNVVEQLLALGANVHIRASNEWTAVDWAKHFGHKEIQELLEANWTSNDSFQKENKIEISGIDAELSEDDKQLLDVYHHSIDDEKVDIDLILGLLHKICSSQDEGAILIFLPGYDDIVKLREKILNDEQHFPDSSRFMLYTLHSHMQSSDQKRVFKSVPPGVRKIILSTNIAETSLTINDVVYVIDSGKVKEKSYDALSGVTQLKVGWVSQASAIQRRGRAGRCRPGVCYHLFSRIRFGSLQQFQVPEILRVPIHELCLQAKLLAPPNIPIADFLARAPDPPAFMVTRNAVTLLKTIDALDPWEELTELGLHLLDLPIEPRLGKMVLYSVVLKCLDPVLTIVCALAYRDPFLLPSQPAQKRAASLAKKKLAADTYSDHMALLRSFQAWQKARADGYEHSFCDKNFLSAATMEMIVGMRTQLLGQLRASGFVRARGGGDIRDLNSNSENWAVVKAALCAGTYPNLIRVDRERRQLITQKESKVRFHQSSVLNKFPTSSKQTVTSMHSKVVSDLPCDWLLYEEMTRTGYTALAHCCTLVSPITIALFAGPARLPHDALHEPDHGRLEGYTEDSDSEVEEKTDGQKAMFKLDDWVSFRVEPEAARLTLHLRQKWHALFLRRMHAPAKPWSQVDEAVVRSVVGVLSAEEQALGLQQPAGIGQRPRPMATDFCPPISMGPQPPSSPSSGGSSGYGHHSPYSVSDIQIRHNSFDLETSDESSLGVEPYSSSFPGAGTSYTLVRRAPVDKNKGHSHGSDERSDSSSVRSAGSGSGSTPISPCTSPSPSCTSGTHIQSKLESTISNATSSNVRYYVIKANTSRMVDVSLARNVWAFTPSTERKLLSALKEGKDVILIFSVQGSGHFQGYARFNHLIIDQRPPEFSAPNLGSCYQIEWLKRANIPFQSTRHLQNSWNENRKVQISRDGQELEPSVGESLCKLWDKVPSFLKSTVISGRHLGYPHESFSGDPSLSHTGQIPCGPWYDTSSMSGTTVWGPSNS